jgi:hypothetical protein
MSNRVLKAVALLMLTGSLAACVVHPGGGYGYQAGYAPVQVYQGGYGRPAPRYFAPPRYAGHRGGYGGGSRWDRGGYGHGRDGGHPRGGDRHRHGGWR